jgi:hypothetical protein
MNVGTPSSLPSRLLPSSGCSAPPQGPRPLTYTGEHPRPRSPPRRPASADAKAATHASPDGHALHSFRELTSHLATLTRSTITIAGTIFDKLSDPTPVQRRAFDLIGVPIPLRLTLK